LIASLLPQHAQAWGDEGHRIIALIAEQYLEPATRAEVSAMLSANHDSLTAHDIASEATWADKYRDSDRSGARDRYQGTRQWHFVDIELDRPDLDQACSGHPRLPPGVPASSGPADACIVDKIDQFEAELANPETSPDERLVALKFLLHLVGDVHQPLHAADNHDADTNKKQVIVDRFKRCWRPPWQEDGMRTPSAAIRAETRLRLRAPDHLMIPCCCSDFVRPCASIAESLGTF
jgi:hypothetical protein